MTPALPAPVLVRALLDTMEEGVLVHDRHGRIVAANPAAARTFGIPLDVLVGTLPDPGAACVLRAGGEPWPLDQLPHDVCLRTRAPVPRTTLGLLVPGGDRRWLSLTSHPLASDDGELGVLTVFTDVTDEMHTATLLEARETDQRLLSEYSRDIITRHRGDGSLAWASASFQDVLGYATEAVVGRQITGVAHPDDLPILVSLWLTATTSGSRDAPPATWRALTVDGRVRWLETRSRSRQDPVTGATVELVAFSRDVTERVEAERATAASEQRFRKLAAFAPIGIFATDAHGACVYTNERWQQIYGLDAVTALGDGWLAGVHPDDRGPVGEAWVEAANRRVMFEREFRLQPPSGGERWVRARATALVDSHDALEGHIGSVEDITEQKAAHTAIAEAGALFLATFEESPIGMALTTPAGRFRKVNRALCDLVGQSARELRTSTLRKIAPFPDGEVLGSQLEERLQVAASGQLQLELRLRRADGSERWVLLHMTSIRRSEERPVEVLVQFIDVTERRTFEEQLQQMADHDPLTGCLNRRSFARSLEEHHARVRRYGADGALIVLDLDNFKAVNDTLGHHVGDQLIVAISEVLKGRIRKSDVLARLGGDEFALLLPNTSAAGAEALAESLLEAIRARAEPFAGPGRDPVSASIGIALFDGSYAHPDEVLVAADDAMYAAKDGGRSRWARARA